MLPDEELLPQPSILPTGPPCRPVTIGLSGEDACPARARCRSATFRRAASTFVTPLAVLELEPVGGEKPRQFLDGLLAVRDQERQRLSPEDRMVWEKRDQALQQQSLDRLWKVATAPWPQTCVGQWLRAGLLGQHELRDRLKRTLNGGRVNGGHSLAHRAADQPL